MNAAAIEIKIPIPQTVFNLNDKIRLMWIIIYY